MKFLFLFGCVLFPACIHKKDVQNIQTKASEEHVKELKGVALVTPSSYFQSLCLTSKFHDRSTSYADDAQAQEKTHSSRQDSKEIIHARLTDIPVMVDALLIAAVLDAHSAKHVTYRMYSAFDEVYEFYTTEFERYGWCVRPLFNDGAYAAILAEKPHKRAVFSLEVSQGQWFTSPSVVVHGVIH